MFRRRPIPANSGPARDPEAGQAMVEFIIVFPLQLVTTVLLMQFALLVIGRTAVDHAAWVAARAAMVAVQDPDLNPQVEAEAAAEQFLLPVTGRDGGTGGPIVYPGWGQMDRSMALNKTRVTIENPNGLRTADRVTATVEHDFYLAVPIANVMTVQATYHFVYMEAFVTDGGAAEALSMSYGGLPHVRLRSTRWIPKPWKDAQQ